MLHRKLSDGCAGLIRQYIEAQNFDGSECSGHPLFSSQTHERMTTACIRNIVAKYVELAKHRHPDLFREANYSPHSFRHSKAVHMVEAGIQLIYIRDFLGHATIKSTERYAKVSQTAITKALTNRQIPVPIPLVKKTPVSKDCFPEYLK